MYILGIAYSMHDSAVALMKDGKIIHAIEEERLNREKHSGKFPHMSIQKVLSSEAIEISDIEYIGLNFRKSIIKSEMLNGFGLEKFPNEYETFSAMNNWYRTIKNIKKILRKSYKFKGKIYCIDHHAAHVASAFYCSPFERALNLSIDGTGEKFSLALWKGYKNTIEFIKGNSYPNSLGLLYSIVTYHLGLGLFGEGKVMGLSSYGEDNYKEFFEDLLIDDREEIFKLNNEYLNYPNGMLYIDRAFNDKALKILGPRRKKNEKIEKRHMDIAASLQKLLERKILKLVKKYLKEYDTKNICISGGVGLNSVMNGLILKETDCDQIFVQPAASDSGTAIGAVMYIYNSILNYDRTYVMESAYLGPQYSKNEIESELKRFNCCYRYSENVEKETAKLISDGKIIGWFQGRMEFGPRALGNRSILADPRNPQMKDILNEKVKHREGFRPFAPVVTEEECEKYFDINHKAPFMTLVCDVKEERKKEIPAIVHVDGTARLQTVSKKMNEKYWRVIDEFKKITDVSVIINTSFNIKGEPIVCSPTDAIKCFLGTNIDYLVIDDFIVNKEKNHQLLSRNNSVKKNAKRTSKIIDTFKKYKAYPLYTFSGLLKNNNSKNIDYYSEGIFYEEL